MYAKTLIASALAAVAAASYNTTTAVEPSTTVITITSCSANKCHETAVTTGVTVVTVTSESITTEYTTYCPLSTTTPASAANTTVPIVTTATGAGNKLAMGGAAVAGIAGALLL